MFLNCLKSFPHRYYNRTFAFYSLLDLYCRGVDLLQHSKFRRFIVIPVKPKKTQGDNDDVVIPSVAFNYEFNQDPFNLKERLYKAESIEEFSNEISQNAHMLDSQIWKNCFALLKTFQQQENDSSRIKNFISNIWTPLGLKFLNELTFKELHDILLILTEFNLSAENQDIEQFVGCLCQQEVILLPPKKNLNNYQFLNKNDTENYTEIEILNIYLGILVSLSKLLPQRYLKLSKNRFLKLSNHPSKKSVANFLKVCYKRINSNKSNITSLKQVVQIWMIMPKLDSSFVIPEITDCFKTLCEMEFEVQDICDLRTLTNCVDLNYSYQFAVRCQLKLIFESACNTKDFQKKEQIIRDAYKNALIGVQVNQPQARLFFARVQGLNK